MSFLQLLLQNTAIGQKLFDGRAREVRSGEDVTLHAALLHVPFLVGIAEAGPHLLRRIVPQEELVLILWEGNRRIDRLIGTVIHGGADDVHIQVDVLAILTLLHGRDVGTADQAREAACSTVRVHGPRPLTVVRLLLPGDLLRVRVHHPRHTIVVVVVLVLGLGLQRLDCERKGEGVLRGVGPRFGLRAQGPITQLDVADEGSEARTDRQRSATADFGFVHVPPEFGNILGCFLDQGNDAGGFGFGFHT